MNDLSMDARIRVKPLHPVYRLDDTRLRIGAQRGLTVEIVDPYEHMRTLVGLLDGARPLGQVVELVRAEFPELSAEDVLAGVRALNDQRLLEDATPTAYDAAGPLGRYLGNVNYFSHFADLAIGRAAAQDLLRMSRCVLLGLGGGGSYMLPMLLSVGFGDIVAVDYDRVELSNLNRQLLYRESDVGDLKTAVAARVARELNSQVRFTAVQQKITSVEQVADLVRGADVAICAIDEPPFVAQRRVNAGCVAENVPFVCGGSFITRGRVFTVQPGETGCLDCLHRYYTRTDPTYQIQLRAALATDLHPVTVAFSPHIGLMASLIVAEAVRLVTGHAKPIASAVQLEVDYEAASLQPVVSWPRDEEGCPVCGAGETMDWAT